MLKLYIAGTGQSNRKAREWLVDHQLQFEEINLFTHKLTKVEFYHITSLTEEGMDDILSKRSIPYERISKIKNIELMTTNELLENINEDCRLLKQPIIVDDNRIQIGYNVEQIRKFLPKKIRKVKLQILSEQVEL